jgi:metal-dependent HD superfamily phosphatase/phosphodiesterase
VLEGLAKITAYQAKDWEAAAKYADRLLSIDDKNVAAYIIMANYFAVVKKDYYNALNMMIESLKFNKAIESIYMVGVLYIKYYEETKKQTYFAEGIRA